MPLPVTVHVTLFEPPAGTLPTPLRELRGTIVHPAGADRLIAALVIAPGPDVGRVVVTVALPSAASADRWPVTRRAPAGA